jgi:peptidoglycan/LPS O-acetylase OafA/YrhL
MSSTPTAVTAPAPLAPGHAATSDGVSHGRRDLPSLTGLRWVAAFLVFAFHSAGYGVTTTPWWHLTRFGFIGVSFFFVLSGVVLTWSMRPGQRAGTFYWRRFARIYPAHLVTGVVAILLYVFVMPPHKPVWAGLLALLLLHAWPPTQTVQSAANGVSWSLSAEAFFYSTFPWLTRAMGRWSHRGRIAFVAAVLGTCSAAAVTFSFVAGGRYDVPAYENPAIRFGEFVLGVALGLALREGWVPRLRVSVAWAAAAAAAGASLLIGLAVDWPVPRGLADVLAVGPLAMVLMAYAGRDLIGRRSWMASRWAVYLGQLSFAFYLVHQLVLDLVLKRWMPLTTASVPGALLRTAVALVLSLAGAAALHHGVELRGQRLLTRRRRSSAPSSVVPYPDDAKRERELARAAS